MDMEHVWSQINGIQIKACHYFKTGKNIITTKMEVSAKHSDPIKMIGTCI